MLAIPEIGQLVHARNRAFVVTEIQPQGLPGEATAAHAAADALVEAVLGRG